MEFILRHDESRHCCCGRMDSLRRRCHNLGAAGVVMKTDIRKAIMDALAGRHMSINELAVQVQGKVHRSHVYDFIAGRKELTTEKANYLLNALGLKIIEDTESAGPAVGGICCRRIK